MQPHLGVKLFHIASSSGEYKANIYVSFLGLAVQSNVELKFGTGRQVLSVK